MEEQEKIANEYKRKNARIKELKTELNKLRIEKAILF